ncbi:MAG: LPS assembly lipoprotein LptE [Steroidobacteraceae bacterium]
MNLRAAASLLILALIAGCGFHLQGRQPLPENLRRVLIDTAETQSDFVSSLRNSLTSAGAVLVTQKGEGVARIHVVRDEVTDRVLTVSSRNIPTDYELTYTVRVSVDGPDGKELMDAEDFTLTRIYSFDERKLLAKEREKDLLLTSMARDMTSVVLRRLGSL